MSATELSKRLTKIREEHGYKRTELAEALGMPYRTVTNYETGEREPGHSYIIKIAKLPNQIVRNLSFHFIIFCNLLCANLPVIPENKKLFAFFQNLTIPRYICLLRSKCGQISI